MEVSGQLHAPVALLPEKEPPVPIGQEAVWISEQVWGLVSEGFSSEMVHAQNTNKIGLGSHR
jgi:hypothetical protein